MEIQRDASTNPILACSMPHATLLNLYQLTNLEQASNLGFRSQKYMTSKKNEQLMSFEH